MKIDKQEKEIVASGGSAAALRWTKLRFTLERISHANQGGRNRRGLVDEFRVEHIF